jgi:hypothetical protein
MYGSEIASARARSGIPLLRPDPCSLLDLVLPAQKARFEELAKDYDGQGGAITESSRCEARLALTMESRGILRPTVARPLVGDVQDGNGQVWDFKGPHCRAAIIDRITTKAAIAGDPPPPVPEGRMPGEFEAKTEVLRAIGQQASGKGVVFDLRRLSVGEARQLVAEVAASEYIDPALVRYFPTSEELRILEEDIQDGG